MVHYCIMRSFKLLTTAILALILSSCSDKAEVISSPTPVESTPNKLEKLLIEKACTELSLILPKTNLNDLENLARADDVALKIPELREAETIEPDLGWAILYLDLWYSLMKSAPIDDAVFKEEMRAQGARPLSEFYEMIDELSRLGVSVNTSSRPVCADFDILITAPS